MEEKEYETLLDMFASEGWKLFIEGAKELEDAVVQNCVDIADTNEKWQYLRGEVHQLRRILGYEDYIRALWAQQEEDAAQDAMEA